MHVILAPDVEIETAPEVQATSDIFPAVHIAASITQNEIADNLEQQRRLLDHRILTKQRQLHDLESHGVNGYPENNLVSAEWRARRTVILRRYLSVSIVLVLMILVILWAAGIQSNLRFEMLALTVIAAVLGASLLWSSAPAIAERQQLIHVKKSLKRSIHDLKQLRSGIKPNPIVCLGRVWWGMELLAIPELKVVPLVLAPSQEHSPLPVIVGEPPVTVLTLDELEQASSPDQLLKAVQELIPLSRSGKIVSESAIFPLFDGNQEDSAALRREVGLLLELQSRQSGRSDMPIFTSVSALTWLRFCSNQYLADWLRCRLESEKWEQHFQGVIAHTKQIHTQFLEMFRENCMTLPSRVDRAHAVFTDWLNLGEQRPDVAALSKNIEVELKLLDAGLEGGIEHAQREQLKVGLTNVLHEARDKPWTDVSDLIGELNSQYSRVESQLYTMSAHLQELRQLADATSANSARPTSSRWDHLMAGIGQIADQVKQETSQVSDDLAQWRSEISTVLDQIQKQTKKRGKSTSDQQLSLNSAVQCNTDAFVASNDLMTQLSQKLSDSITLLKLAVSAETKYWESVTTQSRAFKQYADQFSDQVESVRAVVGEASNVKDALARDLAERLESIRRYEQRIDQLESLYDHHIERARTEGEQRKKELHRISGEIEWLNQESEMLIAEIANIDKANMTALYEESMMLDIQDVIISKAQRAIDHVFDDVYDPCHARRQIIRDACERMDYGIELDENIIGDAEFLLIPLWYVEWLETKDPETPDQQQIRYKLIPPFRLTGNKASWQRQHSGRDAEGVLIQSGEAVPPKSRFQQEPLYPMLEGYMRTKSLPGSWDGKFSLGEVPNDRLPATIREHARLTGDEVKVLVRDAEEFTENGLYMPLLHDVVARSAVKLSK